jgi:hypothetical protein
LLWWSTQYLARASDQGNNLFDITALGSGNQSIWTHASIAVTEGQLVFARSRNNQAVFNEALSGDFFIGLQDFVWA